MTKCLHELCQNEAEPLSAYCKGCIQLPTHECNYCNLKSAVDKRVMTTHTKGLDTTIKILTEAKKQQDEDFVRQLSFFVTLVMVIIGIIVLITLIQVVMKW